MPQQDSNSRFPSLKERLERERRNQNQASRGTNDLGLDLDLVDTANERRVITAPANAQPHPPEVSVDEPTAENTSSPVLSLILEGACCIPIVGNIIALKDVAFDTYILCKNMNYTNIWYWVTLAVDAIGLIPAAGNASVPIRVAVRHGLWSFARGEGIAVLTQLLVDKFEGEIEAFLSNLQQWLDALIPLLKDTVKRLSNSLALFVHNPYDWGKQVNLIGDGWIATPCEYAERLVLKGMDNLLSLMGQQQRDNFEQSINNYGAEGAAQIGRSIGKLVPLLLAIKEAVAVLVAKKHGRTSSAHVSSGIAKEPVRLGAHTSECSSRPASVSQTVGAHHPPCVGCTEVKLHSAAPPSTTHKPIHLVMGDENLWQTDFVVPGLIALEWTRFYRSSCDMLDDSELGARWSSPYHLRFEQADDTLYFIDADSRMLSLAPLAVGEERHEAVEHFWLSRPSDHELVIKTLNNEVQRYEQMGTNSAGRQVFRMVAFGLEDGRALHFEYDRQQRHMTRISDGAALDVHVLYGVEGYVSHIERHFPDSEHGPEVLARYTYDRHGDLMAHTDQRDYTRTYRYNQHLLTFYSNRNALGHCLEWDWPDKASGQPANAQEARCIRTWLEDGSEETHFEYNRGLWYTKVTDAEGTVTFYRYNYHNRIESRTHPYQTYLGSEYWRWDEQGNLITHSDGEGRTTSFEYDDGGRLIKVIDPMSRSLSYQYDEKGRLVSSTDPVGRTQAVRYDEAGRVVEEIDHAGRTTAFTYNDQSLPTRLKDPAGNTYRYEWNEQGLLIASTDCSGQHAYFMHDHRGALIKHVNALKQAVLFQRDAAGLPVVIRYPDESLEQFEYDGEANLTRYTDTLGRETRYAYNGSGLPLQRIDAAGHRLTYQYDVLQRVKRLINQNGEHWTFTFDGVGRLREEVGFDGRAIRYDYDLGGLLTEQHEGDVTTTFDYNDKGTLLSRCVERLGYSARETRYTHDMFDRLTSVHNSHSAVRLHYDAMDNLIAEEQTADLPDGHYYRSVYRHTYDVLGNRQTTTLPNGQEVAWLRYGSGHVHAMSLDRQPLFDFERDALHRETVRHYGPQQQTRQYDVMGRLTRQQRLLGEDAKQQRLYHYTQTSELYGIDDTLKGETRYRYDPIGRLKAASTPLGDETFAFDPAGNLIDPERLQNAEQHRNSQPTNTRWDGVREEVTFDYRNLPKVMGNLLERYAGTHYQYDERGNRRRQTEPSGRTTEYVYDADDQLKEVKRYRRAPATGDTTPPDMHAQYGYDGFGRRLWKLVKEGKAPPKLTVFSWDANLLTSEEVFEGEFHFGDLFMYPEEPELVPEDPSRKFSLPLAQRIHTLTARALKRTHWLYEPDSFIPAAQLVEDDSQATQKMTGTGGVAYSSTMSADATTPEPQLYYIHTDHLGTPQELTDRDGHLQWVGRYRAWGELAKAHNHDGYTASVEMPLRFQGQYCDAETGLHYNRFRYYDPQVGRFTTQDPISLAGGINLYQYAPNPVEWIDSLGLARGKNRKGNKSPASNAENKNCPTGQNDERFSRPRLSRKEAEAIAVNNGYRRTNQISAGGTPIYENKKADPDLKYVAYDVDGHSGGTWKAGRKPAHIMTHDSTLRSGTYDENFNWIAK